VLNDVETGASCALSEDDGILCHFCPEHMLLDVVYFPFRQVVKDEVIFEGGEDELLVDF